MYNSCFHLLKDTDESSPETSDTKQRGIRLRQLICSVSVSTYGRIEVVHKRRRKIYGFSPDEGAHKTESIGQGDFQTQGKRYQVSNRTRNSNFRYGKLKFIPEI